MADATQDTQGDGISGQSVPAFGEGKPGFVKMPVGENAKSEKLVEFAGKNVMRHWAKFMENCQFYIDRNINVQYIVLGG
jgi:hypothetical protein